MKNAATLITILIFIFLAGCTQEARDRMQAANEQYRAQRAACDEDPVCAERRAEKKEIDQCAGLAIMQGAPVADAQTNCRVAISGTAADKQLLEMKKQTKIMQQMQEQQQFNSLPR